MTGSPDPGDWALLGIEPGASADEIHCAFRKNIETWKPGALATYNLMEPEERQERLAAIETAYEHILASSQSTEATVPANLPTPVMHGAGPTAAAPDRESAPGDYLRYLCQRQGMNLKDVERRIKINHVQLEAIEEGRPDLLPAPVFVRGFLIAYAQLLNIEDPSGFAKAYLKDWPQPG